MKRLFSFLLCSLLLLLLPGCHISTGSSNAIELSREKVTDAKMESLKTGSQEFYLIKTERDLQSIGRPYDPFTGIFNGNGYVIYNLTVTERTDPLGFFGGTKGASIQHLVLEEAQINVNDFFPIVFHAIDSDIDNCSINAGAADPGPIEIQLTENYSDSAFTVTLDHVKPETEYVFRFTGTKIKYAKAEISSPDHLIRERTRPLHKKEL